MPNQTKFRQIKFLLRNGRMLRIQSNVSNKTELRKLLRKHNPVKAYMTASWWAEPETLGSDRIRHSNNMLLNHLFLGSDLVFDFDVKEDWEQLRRDVICIFQYMCSNKDYTFTKCVFSGAHGFHLWYSPNFNYPEKVQDRIPFYKRERNNLLKNLPKTETLDLPLLKNIYNIYKIPNSYDFSTGYKVQEIDINELINNPMHTILASLRRTNCVGDDAFSLRKSSVVGQPEALVIHPGEGSRANYLYYFITNKVPGVKGLYVPFIVMRKDATFSAVSQSLDPFYILDYSGMTAILSLKPVPMECLIKIMKRCNAANLNYVLRKGFARIRVSELYYQDGRVLPRPEIIGETIGAHKVISKAHQPFIESLGGHVKGQPIGCEFNHTYETLCT